MLLLFQLLEESFTEYSAEQTGGETSSQPMDEDDNEGEQDMEIEASTPKPNMVEWGMQTTPSVSVFLTTYLYLYDMVRKK